MLSDFLMITSQWLVEPPQPLDDKYSWNRLAKPAQRHTPARGFAPRTILGKDDEGEELSAITIAPKVDSNQEAMIFRLRQDGMSLREVGKQLGVGKSTVDRVVKKCQELMAAMARADEPGF